MDPLKQAAALAPTKRALSFLEEFRNFAFKRSVIDLAIGVIIGGAFTKIVDSLVKNVIMPLTGLALPGEKGYEGWTAHVGQTAVPYGLFIGELVNFVIIALVLFVFLVKFIGWIMSFHKQQAEAAPRLTKDQELLTEIRDLLKKSQPA